jgi:hypothetical protein
MIHASGMGWSVMAWRPCRVLAPTAVPLTGLGDQCGIACPV